MKQFISKYAPAFENNTESYLKHLIKEIGSDKFNSDSKLQEIINTVGLDNFSKAIFKKEDINFYNELFG